MQRNILSNGIKVKVYIKMYIYQRNELYFKNINQISVCVKQTSGNKIVFSYQFESVGCFSPDLLWSEQIRFPSSVCFSSTSHQTCTKSIFFSPVNQTLEFNSEPLPDKSSKSGYQITHTTSNTCCSCDI